MGRTPILACGPFLCLAALSGCGHSDTAPTAEQNRQLANAEAMLNMAPESLSNIDETAVANSASNSAESNQ